MYESFQLNYNKYYTESINAAKWLIDHLSKHVKLKNKKILDWGCGPARIVRHLPDLLNGCDIYGSDYNIKSINWCKKNIENVSFHINELVPPLPFKKESFDIVYAISIFTHLSQELHYKWMNEIYRILKQGGIFLFTTQGDIFKQKLSDKERMDFNNGNIVVKAHTKEGHRTYSAFQPMKFMENLVKDFKVIEYIPGEIKNNYLQQDLWILEKSVKETI
jgi:ubiquinone/menaquinone biosynthesis C-methylase UbiE